PLKRPPAGPLNELASRFLYRAGMTAAPIRDDARILSHLPRVRALALHLAARTGGNVEADELVGAGTVGLLDAATRFDESKGIPFDAFVHARVHGAMLDAMRADDHLVRS